jgi:hypothetical protein
MSAPSKIRVDACVASSFLALPREDGQRGGEPQRSASEVLGDEQAVAFNKERRVLIAGNDVTPRIRQALSPEFDPIVVKSSDGAPTHQGCG